MLDQAIKPSSIVAYLDEFVIGQDEAKRILAVAVYAHYRKIEQAQRDSVEIAKSNVLLIGPSGTGKTLTCETALALSAGAVRDGGCHVARADALGQRGDRGDPAAARSTKRTATSLAPNTASSSSTRSTSSSRRPGSPAALQAKACSTRC